MSAVANLVHPQPTKPSGPPGGTGYSWRECSTPRQGNTLPFRPNFPNSNTGRRQHLNGQQGEGTQPSNPLPVMTREESTSAGK